MNIREKSTQCPTPRRRVGTLPPGLDRQLQPDGQSGQNTKTRRNFSPTTSFPLCHPAHIFMLQLCCTVIPFMMKHMETSFSEKVNNKPWEYHSLSTD